MLDFRMRPDLELALRQPTLRSVLLQQLRMIDLAKRAPILLALIALPTVMWPATGLLIPIAPVLIATVAWPLLVWQGEGPKQRSYHRTLPVGQTTHDLLKILSGALWLTLTVGLTLGLLVVFTIGAPMDLLVPNASVLLNFVTGTLIVYLLVSLFPLLTDRPLEWLLGTAAGVAVLGNLPPGLRGNPLSEFLALVSGGEYGLGVALLGAHLSAEQTLLAREAWLLVHYANEWFMATLLWLTIALVLVIWASRVANGRMSEPFRSRLERGLAELIPVPGWDRHRV